MKGSEVKAEGVQMKPYVTVPTQWSESEDLTATLHGVQVGRRAKKGTKAKPYHSSLGVRALIQQGWFQVIFYDS